MIFNKTIISGIFRKRVEEKKYVRWPLHPEDTSHRDKILNYLKKNKIHFEKSSGYFKGLRRLSRSIILRLPDGQAISFKGGTDKAPGNSFGKRYQNKGLSPNTAKRGWQVSRFLLRPSVAARVSHSKIHPEIGGFFIEKLNEAVTFRDLSIEKNKMIVPATALFHKNGIQILMNKLNISEEEFLHLRKNWLFQLGGSLGEIMAQTGIIFTSAHNQNWMIEVDVNNLDNSKIEWHDLSDVVLLETFIRDNDVHENPELFEGLRKTDRIIPQDSHNGSLRYSVNLFSGTRWPNWYDNASLGEASKTFNHQIQLGLKKGLESSHAEVVRFDEQGDMVDSGSFFLIDLSKVSNNQRLSFCVKKLNP